MMPEIMAALDLNHYWSRAPHEFVYRLKQAGCTNYKVHDPLPTMDLKTTAAYLRNAVLPGKSATIMLDNKECDIPSRVVKAVENHLRMGFDLTTVHARGGMDTLRALEKADFGKHVVVVTVLTSETEADLRRVFGRGRAELELEFTKMGVEAGMQGGVVCSAKGIPALRSIAKNIPFIIPGIHLSNQIPAADQQTSVAPQEAATLGATKLVLGRSFVGTDDDPVHRPEDAFKVVTRQLQDI